jgi:hypothetical protein
VIPRFKVDPVIDVDTQNLRALTAYEVVEGFSVVHDYQPLIQLTWDDAEVCLAAEKDCLERASLADSPADFDRILDSASEEESSDDFDWTFNYMDIGVAGLVHTLSAAGCVTCYSCRQHSRVIHQCAPQVRFATDAERFRILAPLAGVSSCGLAEGDNGLVTAYAASVSEINHFARLIVGQRSEFDALPLPPWMQRAVEALEYQGDFPWAENEI